MLKNKGMGVSERTLLEREVVKGMRYKCKEFLVLILISAIFLPNVNVFATENDDTILSESNLKLTNESWSDHFVDNEINNKQTIIESEKSQRKLEESIVTFSTGNQNTPEDGSRYTVLVLDISGSMEGTPISYEKAAAQKFCSSMMTASGVSYIAIVAYESSVYLTCDYTNNLETLNSSINSLSASGGTNSNAALLKAQELIKIVPENATKNIVFLSDGIPESGNTSTSGPYTSSDSSSYYKYANALYATAQIVQKECNLYTLGCFHSLSGTELVFGQKLMEDIQNAGYHNVEDVDDLEFAFGEISDDITETITKNRYVQQHRDYYQSKNYASEISGNYPENLMQIYNETLDDNTVLAYDTLDTLNKYLSFDFGSLDGSDEYKLLLSEIVSGQMDLEKFYQDSLKSEICDFVGYLTEYISNNYDNMLGNLDDDKKILVERMKEYGSIMQKENYGTDEFENAYQGLKRTLAQRTDVGNIKNAIKERKTQFNVIVDIANVTISTVDSVIDYYVAAQAYICITEEMKEVLNTLKNNITNSDIKNKIIEDNNTCWIDGLEFLDSLQRAITEYMDSMTAVEEGNAHDIAQYIIDEGGCNVRILAEDKFSDFLWSKLPLMEKFKISTSVIQTLVDVTAPNTHLRAYSANLLARLRYIHMFMKYTVDYYGDELIHNSSDSDRAFQLALRFDSAVNLYKSIQILACDYAEQYENCCFISNTDKVNDIKLRPLAYGPFYYIIEQNAIKDRSWNSAAGCLAQVQRLNTQAIQCHDGDFSYDGNSGHISNDKLKIVTIACPVAVSVMDPNGKQVAYLSDYKTYTSSGYEPYFYTCANGDQSADCMKIAIIPSDEDYKILINGNSSGTMDIYIGEYEEKGISGIEYATDVPVNRDLEIKLVSQNGCTVLKTDTEDEYPLNNDVEIWDGNIAAAFKEGDGSENNPYQISNGSELALLSEMVSKGNDCKNVYFLLVSDIDLGEVAFSNQKCGETLWRPIGLNKDLIFKGNFDGNYHQITIKATYQEAETINAGIFGYISGTVKNLNTAGTIDIQSKLLGSDSQLFIYCGGICAFAKEAYINNCKNNIICSVSGGSSSSAAYGYVGGIVGTAEQYSQIVDCTNYQDISCNTFLGSRTDACAGGIAAESVNGSVITRCTNYGNISTVTIKDNEKYFSISYPGGICGTCAVSGNITECINYGIVSGKSNISAQCDYSSVISVGGIVGMNRNSTPEAGIKNCANFSNELIAEGTGYIDTCQKGSIVGNSKECVVLQNITGVDKLNLKYSDSKFDLELSSDSGYLLYQSNNENVVSVSGKGRVYINGIGTAVITVIAPATEKYESATINIPVNVEQGKINLYIETEWEKKISDAPFNLNVDCPINNVTYNSDSDDVVTVDDLGNVTIKGIGEAAITVTVTGYGLVSESIKVNIRIMEDIHKEDISNCNIALSEDTYIYNGKEQCPTVIVNNGEKRLIDGIDYTVSYKNNIDLGTAEVILTGIGNYIGTITKTFRIKEAMKLLSDCQITLSTESYIYTGEANTPFVTIKDGNIILKADIDYTVSYKNNIDVGTAEVILTGKGNYSGIITKTFTIKEAVTEKLLSNCQIVLSTTSVTYNRKMQMPFVTIKDVNYVLEAGTDYSIEYQNNINVGTAKVILTGKGVYKGTVIKTFTIKKAEQNISCITSYKKAYGDKTFTLNVKIENGNGKLMYTSSNKNVVAVDRKGKVTINGTGYATVIVTIAQTENYKANNIKVTIKVTPKKLVIKSVKSKKGRKLAVSWKKDVKATGYQIQCSTDKNFKKNLSTINIGKNKATSKTISKLKKGKRYYIRVRSYKNVMVNEKRQKLYSIWSSVKKSRNIKG